MKKLIRTIAILLNFTGFAQDITGHQIKVNHFHFNNNGVEELVEGGIDNEYEVFVSYLSLSSLLRWEFKLSSKWMKKLYMHIIVTSLRMALWFFILIEVSLKGMKSTEKLLVL